jgi:hypothetical protein
MRLEAYPTKISPVATVACSSVLEAERSLQRSLFSVGDTGRGLIGFGLLGTIRANRERFRVNPRYRQVP